MPDEPQKFEIHKPVDKPVDGWWKTKASPQLKGALREVKGKSKKAKGLYKKPLG